MLFGPEGLFSREGGRNLARFVHELSLGGSTHWLWQLNSSSDANSPFTISSSLDPFPSLTSLTLQTSILSQLSHPSHIHPLDHLLPQLQLSNPFTLTLVTYGPSSSHASPTSPSPRLPDFSSFQPSVAFPDLVEIALPPLPDRHALHQALGFSSPPWTSSLDTLVFEGGPILEALNFRRRGNPFLVLAGSTWSFRRLVVVLPDGQTHFNGARVFRTLFSMDTPSTPIPLPDRLERVELRVGRKVEGEIRELWEVELREGRFSEAGTRLGGMVWFVDEEEEGEGRRLVEE
ncbi:hypothetical protein BDY24DRAFT_383980 [Mrakia frigida]|uniref:uncharacterized protein n=1 Tax=Mrakia frigida TaxID=29902 RepID=UPI003FCC1C92